MNRFTRKIKGANNYCGYELKETPYKKLFNLKSNKEIEDCVDCDLTIAIDKLGELEDVFELIEEMYKKPVYWKADDGEEYSDYYTQSTILYNSKTNEIEIYEYEFIASYKIEEYGITWWLEKDKSE